MRYLVIYRPEAGEEGGAPDPAHMAAMGKLVDEMTMAGALIATEPLAARSHGGRVRRQGGEFTVADEGERAAGYAFLNANSRDEALALCKAFLQVAGDGVTELRQVLEFARPPA
jgi:hypothetical protein